MNVEEMIIEVYENLGEPSDLSPYSDSPTDETFSITEDGSVRILKWLNRAFKRIVAWKTKAGHRPRFPSMEDTVIFKSVVYDGTSLGGDSTYLILPASDDDGNTIGNTDDQYNEWIVEIDGGTGSGQTRLIVDYAGSGRQATVHPVFNTVPDITSTFKLYKRWFKFMTAGVTGANENIALSPKTQMLSPLMLKDVENEIEIKRDDRVSSQAGALTEPGDPTVYILFGNRIWFNRAPDEEMYFILEYLKIPADLALSTDVPDIPEAFHEAIVDWATRYGLKRNQEYQSAYSLKRDVEDAMTMIIDSYEMSTERLDAGFVVEDY
jgi:hypothetical protein